MTYGDLHSGVVPDAAAARKARRREAERDRLRLEARRLAAAEPPLTPEQKLRVRSILGPLT